ncbi:MAG TPA: PAAR domain-containing protein [Blastocatellia bacterium]|nr:PAAR domain-containing protein [Blastocatellia bacterium]
MLQAARKGDEISHTSQLGGLVAGMILGALAGAAILAIVTTGGLAAAPILMIVGAVCTGAAVGGSIGQFIGSMFKVPKGFIKTGASHVFIGSVKRPAARACVDVAMCDDHGIELIATGSTTVFVENFPAARVSDIGQFSFEISKGCETVFIGGDKAKCPGITIEGEVPLWLDYLHSALGWIGGFCLLAPYGIIRAIVSLAGGYFGGQIGGQIGQRIGGKWGGFIGSIIGGFVGGGIGFKAGGVLQRLEPIPGTLGSNFGNMRLRPPQGALDESAAAYGRADSESAQLGPKYANKAVASDGEKTLSGWQGKTNVRPDGFADVPPEQVRDYSQKIGHDLEPNFLDQKSQGGWDGKFNAAHAEKQLAVSNPNEPIGVSSPMCDDCINFYQKQAQFTGKAQIVTDPDGTRIFYPDGSISGPTK